MSIRPLSDKEFESQIGPQRKAVLRSSKYVFLDLESALNTQFNKDFRRYWGIRQQDTFGPFFDPVAVVNLASIIKADLHTKVVLLHDWNDEGVGQMNGQCLKHFLPGFVIDIAERNFSLEEEDFRSLQGETLPQARAMQIRAWLRDNEVADRPFVILDAQDDYGEEFSGHVVLTDPRYGLTDKAARKAIRILKRQSDDQKDV